jgi:nucleoside-diphosphate-sugar epimerase
MNSQSDVQAYYNGKHVLVTGGAGFIGSYVTQKLVACGAHVTVLDNLSTGTIANIAHLLDKISFIEGTVADAQTCLQATDNISHIFHLAAFVSVPQSMQQPSLCHDTNVNGTFNLLHAAYTRNVKRFIFSSSSAVYGPTQERCSETSACNPNSPYGFSKLIGEQLCKQYALNFGVETVCLRYFNVFGDRQSCNGAYAAVVPTFKNNLLLNKPITLFGDGSQTRDFIPVEQVAHINLLLGILPAALITGESFNVATGNSISMIELFNKLKQDFPDYAIAPLYAPDRPGDIKHSVADCSKLHTVISQCA